MSLKQKNCYNFCYLRFAGRPYLTASDLEMTASTTEQPNPNPHPENVDPSVLPTTLFTFSITARPQTFNALCRQAWGLPQVRKKRETAYDMNSKHNKFGIYGKLLRYNNIM